MKLGKSGGDPVVKEQGNRDMHLVHNSHQEQLWRQEHNPGSATGSAVGIQAHSPTESLQDQQQRSGPWCPPTSHQLQFSSMASAEEDQGELEEHILHLQGALQDSLRKNEELMSDVHVLLEEYEAMENQILQLDEENRRLIREQTRMQHEVTEMRLHMLHSDPGEDAKKPPALDDALKQTNNEMKFQIDSMKHDMKEKEEAWHQERTLLHQLLQKQMEETSLWHQKAIRAKKQRRHLSKKLEEQDEVLKTAHSHKKRSDRHLNFTNPPRAKSSPALKAEGGPFETFADIKHSEKKLAKASSSRSALRSKKSKKHRGAGENASSETETTSGTTKAGSDMGTSIANTSGTKEGIVLEWPRILQTKNESSKEEGRANGIVVLEEDDEEEDEFPSSHTRTSKDLSAASPRSRESLLSGRRPSLEMDNETEQVNLGHEVVELNRLVSMAKTASESGSVYTAEEDDDDDDELGLDSLNFRAVSTEEDLKKMAFLTTKPTFLFNPDDLNPIRNPHAQAFSDSEKAYLQGLKEANGFALDGENLNSTISREIDHANAPSLKEAEKLISRNAKDSDKFHSSKPIKDADKAFKDPEKAHEKGMDAQRKAYSKVMEEHKKAHAKTTIDPKKSQDDPTENPNDTPSPLSSGSKSQEDPNNLNWASNPEDEPRKLSWCSGTEEKIQRSQYRTAPIKIEEAIPVPELCQAFEKTVGRDSPPDVQPSNSFEPQDKAIPKRRPWFSFLTYPVKKRKETEEEFSFDGSSITSVAATRFRVNQEELIQNFSKVLQFQIEQQYLKSIEPSVEAVAEMRSDRAQELHRGRLKVSSKLKHSSSKAKFSGAKSSPQLLDHLDIKYEDSKMKAARSSKHNSSNRFDFFGQPDQIEAKRGRKKSSHNNKSMLSSASSKISQVSYRLRSSSKSKRRGSQRDDLDFRVIAEDDEQKDQGLSGRETGRGGLEYGELMEVLQTKIAPNEEIVHPMPVRSQSNTRYMNAR